MRTYNLVCKKITDIDEELNISNVYWKIIKSSNEDHFPIGLLIISEKSSKENIFLEEGDTVGPPFIDKNFERWLKRADLKNYRELISKPKLNIKISFREMDEDNTFKLNTYPATCILDKFISDTDPMGEYIILSIFIERRQNEDKLYLLGEYIEDTYQENVLKQFKDKYIKSTEEEEEDFSRREKNLYLKIELLMKNTNDKLEEILESLFYSNNSFISRIVNLENSIKNIEKENYIPKEDFNIINLFFKGGFSNLITFIIILMIFNEIFTFGPLRSLRVIEMFQNYIGGENIKENRPIQRNIDNLKNTP